MLDISFKRFWELYPRKADKKKAEVSFGRLNDTNKFNAIQGAVHQFENNPQWRNPKLIPLPTTYINGERWNDEIALDTKEEIIKNEGEGQAEMVWSKLTQIYGEPWIKRWGEQMNSVWYKYLTETPAYRLKRGLVLCVRDHKDFPVSFPKFTEYCVPTFGEQTDQPQLPPAPRDEAKALAAIEEMKRILGV